MSGGDLIWGLVLCGTGIFIGVYGELLFRFVLAMIGFVAGFTVLYLVLGGQTAALQILIAVAAGGVGALLLYRLVNFGLYVAGGALGAVLGLVIAGLIGLGSSSHTWLTILLIAVGTGGAGFFGPRLGAMIIPLGTSAVAAFTVVYGYVVLFQSTYGLDASDPGDANSRKSLLVLLLLFFGMAFLSQWNIAKLRMRLRN